MKASAASIVVIQAVNSKNLNENSSGANTKTALTACFGLASFIKFLRAVFFGEMPENLKGRLKEVGLAQIIPLIILSLFSITFGLFAFKVPLPFINDVVEKPLEYAKLWPAPQAIIFILIPGSYNGIGFTDGNYQAFS